jgi:hypothetical protein
LKMIQWNVLNFEYFLNVYFVSYFL